MNLSLLRNSALFADLDETQLSRVADACHQQAYRSGEVMFRKGEEALAMLKPGTCVRRSFVRLLSARLRATNDSLRTFLAMSMF